MKKSISAILIVAALLSCQKKQIKPTLSGEAAGPAVSSDPKSDLQARSASGYRYFFGEPYWCCVGEGGNCLPDIIISTKVTAIAHIFDVIETGVNADIKDVFSKNSDYLGEFLEADEIAGVISGDYTASSGKNKDTGTKYMVLSKTADGTIVIVCPFIF